MFKNVDFRHWKFQFLFCLWKLNDVSNDESNIQALYAVRGPRVNSKHVEYTLNMLSNQGNIYKESFKKKFKYIFETW